MTEVSEPRAARPFRTPESVAVELATRRRIEPLLVQHGFTIQDRHWREHGDAITQIIAAQRGDAPAMRMHVRTCWRRDGRNARERLYAAAQLRARLDDGGFEQTLDNIRARHAREGNTHLLLVQDSPEGFVFAAALPADQIPAIWGAQRAISADLLNRGLTGRMRKNHAENGQSPTIYLQDDRHEATPAVARVVWDWPGVINVLALPRTGPGDADQDTLDDLPDISVGRDGGERVERMRSGFPRDPKVRAAVLVRAAGQCERSNCGESRAYPGFLDVHHILGIDVSDRIWTCVALCPNCHREAHFAPDRDQINSELALYAERFR